MIDLSKYVLNIMTSKLYVLTHILAFISFSIWTVILSYLLYDKFFSLLIAYGGCLLFFTYLFYTAYGIKQDYVNLRKNNRRRAHIMNKVRQQYIYTNHDVVQHLDDEIINTIDDIE